MTEKKTTAGLHILALLLGVAAIVISAIAFTPVGGLIMTALIILVSLNLRDDKNIIQHPGEHSSAEFFKGFGEDNE